MYHPTLNEALAAARPELVDLWPGMPIPYGRTGQVAASGVLISVSRDERGFYETALHYSTKCQDFQRII